MDGVQPAGRTGFFRCPCRNFYTTAFTYKTTSPNDYAEQSGLKINTAKTKVMVIKK
jgi:hypothetical protein